MKKRVIITFKNHVSTDHTCALEQNGLVFMGLTPMFISEWGKDIADIDMNVVFQVARENNNKFTVSFE